MTARSIPLASLLCGAFLTVHVDRVEADHAVLEWNAELWTALPLQMLPRGIHEGDRLQLEWTRLPRLPPPPLPPQSELPDLLSPTPHPVESPQPSSERTDASKEPPC